MPFAFRFAIVVSVSAACVGGCGGAEFVSGSGDGGSGNTHVGTSDAGGDTGPAVGSDGGGASDGAAGGGDAACVVLPASTGDEAPFCSVEAELFDTCNQCQACRQTDLNNCVALGDDLSSAFKTALTSCETQIPCGDYSTYGSAPCVAASLTSSTKSNDQISAATEYCTRCQPAGVNACVTDYFTPPQADGGAAGVGYIVLLSSDAIAQAITTACASDCTAAAYELCATTQFCKAQQGDSCGGTGFCAKQ